MKIDRNFVTLTALCLTLAAPASTRAAGAVAKTNNVMVLNFSLTAWPNATAGLGGIALPQAAGLENTDTTEAAAVPETTTGAPFSIVSSDIISSLNGVTNKGAAMHFSKQAKLLYWQVVSPRVLTINALGTNRQIIVRDGATRHTVETDISSFFTVSDQYVSTRTVASGLETHKYSTLSFSSPGHLTLDFTALTVEETAPTNTSGVAVIRSLTWNTQGYGESTNSTPDRVVSGVVSTSQETLE